jgi:alpha/beta superfamily hydrolase
MLESHLFKLGNGLPPPRQCEKYPPVLNTDKIVDPQSEFNFFIDCEEGLESIACSFICRDYLSEHGKSVSVFEDLIPKLKHCKTPVIIVCHGLLSWRNQMLIIHLAANLSVALKCNTMRFDFIGNGHSSGTWRLASYDQDFYSLHAVVCFVSEILEIPILCIIGHSRATCAVIKFASSRQAQSCGIPCFVNLSGRFNAFHGDRIITSQHKRDLEAHGQFELMRRGTLSYIVTSMDLEECNRYDMSIIDFQNIKSHVLTIHGDCDQNVPVENAICFDKALGCKHTLRIIQGADHNFNGLRFMADLVINIVEFITKCAYS